jgi:hypothetical protein
MGSNTSQLPKIDHPKFKHYSTVPGHVIACFTFGYYEQPPAEVLAAQERVLSAIRSLKSDAGLMNRWDGRVRVETVCSRLVNPEITDEMVTACEVATMAANPGATFDKSWCNNSNGTHGVSVRFRMPDFPITSQGTTP